MIRPEPKQDESYQHFAAQRSGLLNVDISRLFAAFSFARAYTHEPNCNVFCLNLNEEAKTIVQTSIFKGLNEAFTLKLETGEEEAKTTTKAELETVKGINFCCSNEVS